MLSGSDLFSDNGNVRMCCTLFLLCNTIPFTNFSNAWIRVSAPPWIIAHVSIIIMLLEYLFTLSLFLFCYFPALKTQALLFIIIFTLYHTQAALAKLTTQDKAKPVSASVVVCFLSAYVFSLDI